MPRNLQKILKPSWWAFQIKRRNVFSFWWVRFRTPKFPDDWTSVNDVIQFGMEHTITGFNRETIRAYIAWRVHQQFSCTSFVETGTFYGQTTGYVQKVFKTPVFTSEINRTNHLVSKANLFWAKGITSLLCSSPDLLKKLCGGPEIGSDPMFYLDAHWYEYMPLPEELQIIANQCQRAVVLIDDFYQPHQPDYFYDEYPDIRIDLELVQAALDPIRDDVSVYLPSYSPEIEPTGKGIGFAVVLIGYPDGLPLDEFPYDLLISVPSSSAAPVPGTPSAIG